MSGKEVEAEFPGFITFFKDGSFRRHAPTHLVPADPSHRTLPTKDVVIDAANGLWLRLYLPKPEDQHNLNTKMPLVLYFHGGGYCIGDPDLAPFHSFAAQMSHQSRSIWLSLSYRRAPEHRLPAAYEDAMSALRWLQAQAKMSVSMDSKPGFALEPWLHESADFSKCLIAGESAGAAIALNLAIRLAAIPKEDENPELPNWSPLDIKGLALIHPGFQSEQNRAQAVAIEPYIGAMYASALPLGENLDYPPVNPLNPKGPSLARLSVFRNLFVAVAGKDFRYALTMDFCSIVEKICEGTRVAVSMEGGHAFHIFDPDGADSVNLQRQLAAFIAECSAPSD